MADNANDAALQKAQMPKTVHELHTGPKPEQRLAPGTLVTDAIAKEHKLDTKAIQALTATGAIELVEVLKA